MAGLFIAVVLLFPNGLAGIYQQIRNRRREHRDRSNAKPQLTAEAAPSAERKGALKELPLARTADAMPSNKPQTIG